MNLSIGRHELSLIRATHFNEVSIRITRAYCAGFNDKYEPFQGCYVQVFWKTTQGISGCWYYFTVMNKSLPRKISMDN